MSLAPLRLGLVAVSLALLGGGLWLGKKTVANNAPPSDRGAVVPVATPVAAAAKAPAANRILPDRRGDQPEIEITANHQLARVRHKDAAGLQPLELVETPEGTVTIRRTFRTDDHTLLAEEAFLNGKPVPVPKPSK